MYKDILLPFIKSVVDDRNKANDSTSLQIFIVAHREVSTTDVVEVVEFLARGACSSGMQESLARANSH
jgi:hypothetical protein